MNFIKGRLISFLEKGMSKTAAVLAIRYWANKAIIELDLHVPDMQASTWTSAPHMKIKVADGVYRDYTPTMWDAETKTCSLILHTGHDGLGSEWGLSLRTGDLVTYIGIGNTPHRAVGSSAIIGIGDESSLGHFVALQQLLGKSGLFSGAIGFTNPEHVEECRAYMNNDSLNPVLKLRGSDPAAYLKDWLAGTPLTDQLIYVAGGNDMVMEMKKFIRQMPFFSGTVKTQGFWK